MNVNTFYDLSIETVKTACEKYWLDKDVSFFNNHLCAADTPVIGLDLGDEDGFYKILESSYKGRVQQENICVVTAKLEICDTEKIFALYENVDVMVVCVQEAGEIRFSAVHMAITKKKILGVDTVKSPDFYYRKLMGNMCDLLIEAKIDKDVFIYDEAAYYEIFHEKRKFIKIDQWFWHLCDKFVVEQDLERLDLFREVDLEKRLTNQDYVVNTTFRIKRDEDEIVWLKVYVVFMLDSTGESLGELFIMLSDCTKEMEEKMKNLEFARKDYLTGIYNRRYTEELINQYMGENTKGIFILFDIDKFKNVNDTYGHMTGDELLIKMSENVGKNLVEGDVFGRLGGDEFVLWLSGSEDKEADKSRVWEIFENTKFKYKEKDDEIDVHSSVGVVFVNEHETSFEELYAKADKAMYQAKGAGRNTMVIA